LSIKPPKLFPEPQGTDDFPIALDILALQIVQQSPSLPNQFQQASSGMMVLAVDLEMLVQMADPLGEKGNLNLWGSCVCLMELEPINQHFFFFDC
jgi:hypothetical protein